MQLSDVEIEIGVREETGDGEFRKAHGLNELVTLLSAKKASSLEPLS
jgi:hypothetical protein